MLAIETGWPPPELFVTVTITSGMLAAPSVSISRSSAATSRLPLKGTRSWVSAASGRGQIDGPGTRELDVGARGVEVGVVRNDMARLAGDGEQDALGGAALVRGDDVAESSEILRNPLQAIETGAAGIRLVAAHHGGPLRRGHGGSSGVGEEIDQDIVGVELEEVVADGVDESLAFAASSLPDRFDALDPEGLDDGFHSRWRHDGGHSGRR